MQDNYILESLDYTIKSVTNLIEKAPILERELSSINTSIDAKQQEKIFWEECKQLYLTSVDSIYEESIGALKNTLNTAVQYIMFDKNYNVNINMDDKRGTKTLEFTLNDLDQDLEVDLKDGVGQGVRTIISFVLKMYYLLNKNSKILLLDEKYSALSAHYIPRFFEFMSEMCKKENIIIIMVTHDERFIEYSDKTYMVNDGNIILLDKDEVSKEDLKQWIKKTKEEEK